MDDKNEKQNGEKDDIEEIVNMLDSFAQSETARMKLKVSEDVEEGKVEKVYHHGRCDVGSPWAKGQACDVLEEDIKEFRKKQREDRITHLVVLEWNAFDKARNVDGRAACQDDWDTFQLMRRSQYMTWTDEMLQSFTADFKAANACGRNLIAEKYGWMMEPTSPEEFAEIKSLLPETPLEKRKIVDEIVKIQVAWMEDLETEQPDAASRMRSIHTSTDTPYNTSYETYLRGELLTYSDQTLMLYGRFIAELASNGENLAKITIANTEVLLKRQKP